MSTMTESPARVKAARRKKPRSVRWMARLESGAGVVRITEGGTEETFYFLTPIPADYGRAFRWEKIDREAGAVSDSYDCNTGGDGEPASCECKGHLRWGHKTLCKHLAAVAVLMTADATEQ